MIKHINIKEALKEMNTLLDFYKALINRQTYLRNYARNNDADDDTNNVITINRILLRTTAIDIRLLRENIKELDRESTRRDVERKKSE